MLRVSKCASHVLLSPAARLEPRPGLNGERRPPVSQHKGRGTEDESQASCASSKHGRRPAFSSCVAKRGSLIHAMHAPQRCDPEPSGRRILARLGLTPTPSPHRSSIKIFQIQVNDRASFQYQIIRHRWYDPATIEGKMNEPEGNYQSIHACHAGWFERLPATHRRGLGGTTFHRPSRCPG